MGMVFGDIFCCYPFLLDFVQRVGPGILHLYARTTLLHSSAFCACIFAMLSRTLSLLDETRNSRFRFFIYRIRERGVGVWIWEEISRNDFGYVINFAMDTKFTPNGFAYVFIHSAFSMLW